MSAIPRRGAPGDPSFSDELRAAHQHYSNVNGMGFDPSLATLLKEAIEVYDALVEALQKIKRGWDCDEGPNYSEGWYAALARAQDVARNALRLAGALE